MSRPSLFVHGGAGIYGDESLPDALVGVREAAALGFARLLEGQSAVEAVLAAVRCLEDDPHFNAGTGSVLTADGTIENDAAVMWGKDLSAGAVGATSGFKNPVLLADAIRRTSSHVLLVGDGARRFGERAGIPVVDPATMITERQRARWIDEARRRSRPAESAAIPDKHGTVGAVAVDRDGHVAAATSTGGLLFKLPGRVGDSPIVGAGTYADDLGGACSCTGHGEAILKVSLAKTAVDLMRAGHPPTAAAESALAELSRRTGGEAGLIVVNAAGDLGVAFNTRRMSRASCSPDRREPEAAIER